MIEYYIEQAMRTNSPTTGTHDVHPDLVHAALGMTDELLELSDAVHADDIPNAIEEMGDFCWFIALAASRLGSNPFVDYPPADALEGLDLERLTHRFVSAIKRAYAYGAPLDVPALQHTLSLMVGCITEGCSDLEFTHTSLLELLDANLRKLKARFPERFSTTYALDRDLEAERAALQGT